MAGAAVMTFPRVSVLKPAPERLNINHMAAGAALQRATFALIGQKNPSLALLPARASLVAAADLPGILQRAPQHTGIMRCHETPEMRTQ
jgi:hypothetical protein